MPRSSPVTSPSVRSTASGSAKEPTRRRPSNTRAVSGSSARKAVQRELLVAAGERYLEASRPTSVLAAAPLSPGDKAKLAYAQADQMVSVLRAVLEGLNLSDADYTRGIDLAIEALRASSSQGWEPL